MERGKLESLRVQKIFKVDKTMVKKGYKIEEAIYLIFEDTWEEADHDSSESECAYSDVEEAYSAGVDPDMDW